MKCIGSVYPSKLTTNPTLPAIHQPSYKGEYRVAMTMGTTNTWYNIPKYLVTGIALKWEKICRSD